MINIAINKKKVFASSSYHENLGTDLAKSIHSPIFCGSSSLLERRKIFA